MLSYSGCHARATYICCIGTHAHGHHVKLHLSIFRDFWLLILKYKKTGMSKKKNPLFEGCLVMPNGDPWEGFVYPTLTLIIDSYILSKNVIHILKNTSFASRVLALSLATSKGLTLQICLMMVMRGSRKFMSDGGGEF